MTTNEVLARALAHHQAGRLGEAEALYRRILGAEPAHADALHLLGVLTHQAGDNEQAVELIGRAIALNAGFADYHSNLGHALWELGRHGQAEASCRRALGLREAYPEAWNNLGNALWAQGRLEEAIASYERALGLRPEYAEAHNNLGNVLRGQGRLAEAEASYRQALGLQPDFADAWSNLGMVLRVQGQLGEAIACYHRALEIDPDNAGIHSNLIFALDFDPATTAAAAFAERRRWNDRHARRFASPVSHHGNDRTPDRRLRIGYVSADFSEHSAAAVFAPVLFRHDRERFDVVCYSGVARPDAATARFHAAAALWRPIAGLPDDAVARLIREDGIDILVDLSGHSAGNRLLVFARKPAPVQVTAWGHALGTGLDAVEYFFADRVTVPAKARRYFSERVVDLPSLVCYNPLRATPDAGPLPALQQGYVTFGCLNRRSKMSDDVLDLWSRILSALVASRLLVKDEAFNTEATRQCLRERLGARGVAAERLTFLGGSSRWEHLAAYARVDLVLDPFPHGGGVTALEGLWMGVPMVTLCGERIPARMGASFLSTLGLDDFVAATPEGYVELALRHAHDLPRLARLRSGLRDRMRRSVLLDHATYTRAVESAYRAMWRRWCDTSHPIEARR